MPAPVIAAIIAAAATTTATVYAANKSANASENAANLASQSNTNALNFQREQATVDAQRAEVNRHANYDQWAAQQGRLSTLGELVGLPQRNIPAYVPMPAGGTGSPTAGATPQSGSGTPTINPQGNLAAQISAYFRSRGVSDQETPYWVQQWPSLLARGQQLGDPNYAMTRLSQAEVFGGPTAGSAPTARTGPTFAPYTPNFLTPTTQGPQMPNPYLTTLGSLA